MWFINLYKRWTFNRSEKEKRYKRQEIQDEINISLRKDSIWLVVCGVAVYKANENDTAGQIVRKANEIFSTAKDFREL